MAFISNCVRLVAPAFTVAVLAALAAAPLSAADPVLPDSPNYVEKLTDEQLAVATEQGPGERVSLCLNFAAERIRELEALTRAGNHQHSESLVEAWRILVFSGSIRTAQQGSARHHDMRAAFAKITSSLEADAVAFTRLTAESGPQSESFNAAAAMALKGAAEAKESALLEGERVARHQAMLEHGTRLISEALQGRGASAAEAAAAADRLRAECMHHEQLRADLAVTVMAAAAAPENPSAAAMLAARVNALVEAGAREQQAIETIRFLAGRGYSPDESAKVVRELEKFAEKGSPDRAAAVTGSIAMLNQSVNRGAGKAESAEILRKSARMLDKGVPASIIFEIMGENLKSVDKADSKKVMAAVEASLKAIEAVREKLKNKAQAELDRLIEKSKVPEPGSKGKSGQ